MERDCSYYGRRSSMHAFRIKFHLSINRQKAYFPSSQIDDEDLREKIRANMHEERPLLLIPKLKSHKSESFLEFGMVHCWVGHSCITWRANKSKRIVMYSKARFKFWSWLSLCRLVPATNCGNVRISSTITRALQSVKSQVLSRHSNEFRSAQVRVVIADEGYRSLQMSVLGRDSQKKAMPQCCCTCGIYNSARAAPRRHELFDVPGAFQCTVYVQRQRIQKSIDSVFLRTICRKE